MLLTKGIHHEEADLGMGERDMTDSFICPFIHEITIYRVISMYQELCCRVMLRKTIQRSCVGEEGKKNRGKPEMPGY